MHSKTNLVDTMRSSYLDRDRLQRPYFGKATDFVVHAWETPIQALRDALANIPDGYGGGGRAAAKRFFWIDAFAVTQHASDGVNGDMDAAWERQLEIESLPSLVRRTERLCLVWDPWDAPTCLTRVWCMYELLAAHTAKAKIVVAPTKAGLASMKTAEGTARVRSVLEGLRVVDGRASLKADWKRLHHEIEDLMRPSLEDANAKTASVNFGYFNEKTGRGVCVGKTPGHTKLDALLRGVLRQTLTGLGVTPSAAVKSRVLTGHCAPVNSLTLVGGGLEKYSAKTFASSRIASGSDDGTVRVWALDSAREEYAVESRPRPGAGGAPQYLLDDGRALDKDSHVLAVAALGTDRFANGLKDGTVVVRKASDGSVLWVLGGQGDGHAGDVYALCAPTPQLLVTGSRDARLMCWSLATGKNLCVMEGHTSWIYALATLSPKRVASGGADKDIRLWLLQVRLSGAGAAASAESVDAQCTGVLKGHGGPVFALATLWSLLISGSLDKTIRVWDLDSGATMRVLTGHTSAVRALATIDGNIVSGSRDATIRVWDAATGAQRRVLTGHAGPVHSVVAARNGGRVVVFSASADATIRLWENVVQVGGK